MPTLGKPWGWLVVALMLGPELACHQANDLGVHCKLVRRDPADTNTSDGISSIDVTQGELPQVTGPSSSQRDYISFGSTACENLVCVRDSAFSEANEPGLSVGSNFAAYGVCSSVCSPSAQATCKSADSSIDTDPRTHLSCRRLVLDEVTLARIHETDPVRYQQYFGTNTSPYFCARGTEPTP